MLKAVDSQRLNDLDKIKARLLTLRDGHEKPQQDAQDLQHMHVLASQDKHRPCSQDDLIKRLQNAKIAFQLNIDISESDVHEILDDATATHQKHCKDFHNPSSLDETLAALSSTRDFRRVAQIPPPPRALPSTADRIYKLIVLCPISLNATLFLICFFKFGFTFAFLLSILTILVTIALFIPSFYKAHLKKKTARLGSLHMALVTEASNIRADLSYVYKRHDKLYLGQAITLQEHSIRAGDIISILSYERWGMLQTFPYPCKFDDMYTSDNGDDGDDGDPSIAHGSIRFRV